MSKRSKALVEKTRRTAEAPGDVLCEQTRGRQKAWLSCGLVVFLRPASQEIGHDFYWVCG